MRKERILFSSIRNKRKVKNIHPLLLISRKQGRRQKGFVRYESWSMSSPCFSFKLYLMYLELDFTKSFHKLKELFEAYNQVLKVEKPHHYKKLSLKSTHLETMKEILRFYGAYLHRNRKYELSQDRRFWITNTGIAKNKLQHRSTIYRHIVTLQQSGILTNKIFHGSDCGIEVEIHKYIIVYKNTIQQSKQWIQQELMFIEQNTKMNYDIVATCKDNDSGNFPETYNINKDCKKVQKEYSNTDYNEILNQKQGSKVYNRNYNKLNGKIEQKQETIIPRAGSDITLIPSIKQYTDKAWDFAKRILYPDKIFKDHEVLLTKKYISEYFSLISSTGYKSNVDRLFNDFCERILLAQRYIDRSPSRFIPVPWTWFDKHFSGGFTGTLPWLKIAQEKRRSLKKQYSNLSELCRLYNSYSLSISISSYKFNESRIKSMGDEELTKLYHGCVANKNNFNSNYLHEYYRKNRKQ